MSFSALVSLVENMNIITQLFSENQSQMAFRSAFYNYTVLTSIFMFLAFEDSRGMSGDAADTTEVTAATSAAPKRRFLVFFVAEDGVDALAYPVHRPCLM